VALAHPTVPGDIDHPIADDRPVVEPQCLRLDAARGASIVLVATL
jgi:hypothetical protein